VAAATAASATDAGATDGRVQRGERNRAAIVDALLALVEGGEPRPSARAVAERAGVSLRSVFQHFDDMEALYAACVDRQLSRVVQMVEPIDPELPLETRIDAVVAQRNRVFERVAPIRRTTILAAPSSPVLQAGLKRAAGDFRSRLAAAFARELRSADRKELLAALDAATSFEAWDQMRRTQGLGLAATQRVMARLVRGVLRGGTT
jgi:AcrR family transcriptional regulator